MARTSQAITKKDLEDLGNKLSEDLGNKLSAGIAANKIDLEDLGNKLSAGLERTNAEVHRLGVLVETTLVPKVQATLEGLTSTREELLRGMTEMEARLDRRIGVLESVVQAHSSHIEHLTTKVDHLTTKVDHLTAHVDQLTAEVRDLRRRFDRREDLDAIERRVTEIEQQLARRPE